MKKINVILSGVGVLIFILLLAFPVTCSCDEDQPPNPIVKVGELWTHFVGNVEAIGDPAKCDTIPCDTIGTHWSYEVLKVVDKYVQCAIKVRSGKRLWSDTSTVRLDNFRFFIPQPAAP